MLVFLLVAYFYPDFNSEDLSVWDAEDPDSGSAAAQITPEIRRYIWMIGFQVLIATGLLVYFRKVYFEHFPFRLSWLSAVLVGAVGVVLWVGLCQLQLEPRLLQAIGIDSSRPEFNPYTIDNVTIRVLFLTLRFVLLALIVPIVEELFLRGWLVRWIENPSWENVSLTGLSMKALLTASIYGVLTHPAEAIAAFLWFGMVSWLMNRTGNLWDCVVAHAVTNLLLGIYILKFEQWQLW